MVIDLHSPGVQVRPLREITGDAVFSEVFLDDVFVPDADVVGAVDAGWTVARATLGNERVSIGGGGRRRAAELVKILAEPGVVAEAGADRQVGLLLAEEQAIELINLRRVARSVAGREPGAEGAVTKLLIAEHIQRVSELWLRIAGIAGVDGSRRDGIRDYLMGRAMTIAGGTSEIARNVIAERLLGLPREPIGR
jgi:3-oxochol-4-en-24-oyl-CoA dehydrogenase